VPRLQIRPIVHN